MKRIISGLALVALAVFTVGSSAAAQRTTSVGVSAGLSLPTGDMADFQSSGFHVGGQLTFSPATLPFEVMLDVIYHSFSGNDDTILGETADFSFLQAGAAAVFPFGGESVRPYLLGGLGMYFGKADIEGAESTSDFGFNFGGGFRFMLSGLTSYLQARVNIVDESTFIPISFGIIF